jgi:hypothetical protein
VQWLLGFQVPLPHLQKGEVGWTYLAYLCLPRSTQPLGCLCQWFPVFFFFFLFFSWQKYFAKDQVIGEGSRMGARAMLPPISSEAGGVNLQQQLKRK